MTDMESRYGIDTINHSHTTKAIRDQAFRAKPDLGVKISSSAFIRSLSQFGRKIQNMMSNMSQEEIDRNKNLVEGSDNSDSINELNKEC